MLRRYNSNIHEKAVLKLDERCSCYPWKAEYLRNELSSKMTHCQVFEINFFVYGFIVYSMHHDSLEINKLIAVDDAKAKLLLNYVLIMRRDNQSFVVSEPIDVREIMICNVFKIKGFEGRPIHRGDYVQFIKEFA